MPSRDRSYNPLTPALVDILCAAVELRTLDSKSIAKRLYRSRWTVTTQWQRILETLEAHLRFEAILEAQPLGLLTLPCASPHKGTLAAS